SCSNLWLPAGCGRRQWLLVSSSLYFVSIATASSAIYTLSLHDALPIFPTVEFRFFDGCPQLDTAVLLTAMARALAIMFHDRPAPDRKSTRLNSSHVKTSYAVFCLKKKKKHNKLSKVSLSETYAHILESP